MRTACSLAAIGLLGILLTTPAIAQAPPSLIEEVLPNGLEVTILPDDSHPVVATQIWYHVGSANETTKARGFAHLFEHLMFGGTATHDKRDYWEHHRLNLNFILEPWAVLLRAFSARQKLSCKNLCGIGRPTGRA